MPAIYIRVLALLLGRVGRGHRAGAGPATLAPEITMSRFVFMPLNRSRRYRGRRGSVAGHQGLTASWLVPGIGASVNADARRYPAGYKAWFHWPSQSRQVLCSQHE